MGKLSNFLPSRNAFQYSNDNWPSEPDLTLSTPFGNIPIGDASNGLCGGMAFAPRDLFEAGRPPPATGTNPLDGGPVLGFFTVPYGATDPSDVFEDGNTPPAGWQSPVADSVLTGDVTFAFEAFPDVDAVNFSASYATNPADITTVAWRDLGHRKRRGRGSKQGVAVPPTVYRLFSTENNVAPPPPAKALTCVVVID
jgi:hypothetical protein